MATKDLAENIFMVLLKKHGIPFLLGCAAIWFLYNQNQRLETRTYAAQERLEQSIKECNENTIELYKDVIEKTNNTIKLNGEAIDKNTNAINSLTKTTKSLERIIRRNH